jgi:hypothetical protein
METEVLWLLSNEGFLKGPIAQNFPFPTLQMYLYSIAI